MANAPLSLTEKISDTVSQTLECDERYANLPIEQVRYVISNCSNKLDGKREDITFEEVKACPCPACQASTRLILRWRLLR